MATRYIDHVLTGDHASRPGAGSVPQGTQYSCTDHGLIYQSDGTSTWSTWHDPGDATPGSHSHAGSDITSGTVADARIDAAIARDSELTTHEADTTSVHGITDTSTLYRAGGTDVAVADGGTGASTASAARTALGLAIGTDVPAQATFDDHNARHETGGADAIKLDDLAAPDDNTDLNASASKHGLLPKLSGDADDALRGDGTWGAVASSGGGGGSPALLAFKQYQPGSDSTVHTSSSPTSADVDATNAAVAFTVPASGQVRVSIEAFTEKYGTSGVEYWQVREGTTVLAEARVGVNTLQTNRKRWEVVITGLTPGASKTWKFGHSASAGSTDVYAGPTYGALLMTVEDAALGDPASVAVRVVRGRVNADGSVPAGQTGYTAAKTTTGQYTVTFDTPFAALPAVFVQADGPAASRHTFVVDTRVGAFDILSTNFGGSDTDTDFSFVAFVTGADSIQTSGAVAPNTKGLWYGSIPIANSSTGASEIHYSRVVIPTAIAANKICLSIHSSAGNLDLGIYADDGTGLNPGAKIVSLGSTASPGNGSRKFTIAPGTLQPGVYWLAFVTDTGSLSFGYLNPGTGNGGGGPLRCLRQTSTFPLPATAGAGLSESSWTAAVWIEVN